MKTIALLAHFVATMPLTQALALPPPPVIVSTGPNNSPAAIVRTITRFVPGAARCEGGPVTPRLVEEPLPAGSRRPKVEALAAAAIPAEIVLTFRIDAQGRPLGIAMSVPTSASYLLDTRDVMPAFAAWRFASGQERRGCTISFAVRSEALDTIPVAVLYRYLALQRPGSPGFDFPIGQAAFDRVRPAGSDCQRDPVVRNRAFPAFEDIPQPPGTRSHSFLAHDVDPKGRPRNIRLLGSSGNAELDRRSVAAVGASRFAPVARTGCVYYYFRNAEEPMAAPEAPSPSSLTTPGSNCPLDDGFAWSKLPDLTFPDEFGRRGIEGWALIRFDVAPWGDVGNVTVAAAEPAASFGERALSVVRAAKKVPSDQGYRGCVTRVVFRLPTS